jgi:hypothetical protein
VGVTYNFKKGTDLSSWHWLNQYMTGASQPGCANAYDGSRYIYWAIQSGSATAASTTQLWRHDTWSNGWQFLVALTNAFTGIDIEYDSVRNVLFVAEGNNTTVWRYFNLNTTAITLLGLTTNPFALSSAIGTALPAAATTGASIAMTDDVSVQYPTPLTASGATTSTLTSATTTAMGDTGPVEFHSGMIGSYLRMTSGAQSGQKRVITAVTDANNLTVVAFGTAPVAGDSYVIELPGGDGPTSAALLTASSATASTLVLTGASWPTNAYRDHDVVIYGGTGAGQRRRIASNDGTTLTLAAAVTGNNRTGNWTTTPDATSTFRIVPSSDFLYLFVGSTSMYRVDVLATTIAFTTFATVPAAPGAGSNAFHTPVWSPQSLVVFRGGATTTVYRYHIGLQTWTTLTSAWGAETLTTGGTAARIPGRGRFLVHIGGSTRLYMYNPITGELQPMTPPPYAVPTALEGKRLRHVKTADGVEFIYMLRAGGQEYFRLPVEFL